MPGDVFVTRGQWDDVARGGLEQRRSWRPKKVIVVSGGRFWARGRDREQAGEMADEGPAGALTGMDRCDRCGALAYVRVRRCSGSGCCVTGSGQCARSRGS